MLPSWEPLFATPCCNISRATWSTPSEPSHKKPFFEVLSFSALFDLGCCCQLVCFEFGVLVYPKRAGLRTRTLAVVFGFGLAGCCCQLVCFEFVVPHFRLPIPETRNGQIVEHVVRTTEKKQKIPPRRPGHVAPRGASSCRCANAAILNATS